MNKKNNQMEEEEVKSNSKELAFQVFVRVRPPLKKEIEGGDKSKTATANASRGMASIIHTRGNELFVQDPYDCGDYAKSKAFSFDCVFNDKNNNKDIFDRAVSPLIQSIFAGINATCFAYGMTGAGKTHTMLGDIYHTSNGEAGLCTMAIEAVFKDKIKKSVLKLSYLEIYNEHAIDLLNPSSSSNPNLGLLIVEDPIKGISVPELSEYEIHSQGELRDYILKGNENRKKAETGANQFSSRSHAIMQITLEYRNTTSKGIDEIVTSKLSLVDLAGSERAATNDSKGLRILEGGKINKSLLALGNCIKILSDKGKAGVTFVPYRDSKLTRLLKDSLGGNTKTVMIACISPGGNCYEESINTLNYAMRAKNIKKKIVRNAREFEMQPEQYKEIIESLKAEIFSLKDKLQQPSEGKDIQIQLKCKDNIRSLESTQFPPVKILRDDSQVPPEELQEIEAEILKARLLREQYQEELSRDNEDIVKSLKLSEHFAQPDNDGYLNRLSQELLAKYEEHYEMRQSVSELTDIIFRLDQSMISGMNYEKLGRLAEFANEDKDKRIAAIQEELEKVKRQLKDKEEQLESIVFNLSESMSEKVEKQEGHYRGRGAEHPLKNSQSKRYQGVSRENDNSCQYGVGKCKKGSSLGPGKNSALTQSFQYAEHVSALRKNKNTEKKNFDKDQRHSSVIEERPIKEVDYIEEQPSALGDKPNESLISISSVTIHEDELQFSESWKCLDQMKNSENSIHTIRQVPVRPSVTAKLPTAKKRICHSSKNSFEDEPEPLRLEVKKDILFKNTLKITHTPMSQTKKVSLPQRKSSKELSNSSKGKIHADIIKTPKLEIGSNHPPENLRGYSNLTALSGKPGINTKTTIEKSGSGKKEVSLRKPKTNSVKGTTEFKKTLEREQLMFKQFPEKKSAVVNQTRVTHASFKGSVDHDKFNDKKKGHFSNVHTNYPHTLNKFPQKKPELNISRTTQTKDKTVYEASSPPKQTIRGPLIFVPSSDSNFGKEDSKGETTRNFAPVVFPDHMQSGAINICNIGNVNNVKTVILAERVTLHTKNSYMPEVQNLHIRKPAEKPKQPTVGKHSSSKDARVAKARFEKQSFIFC